MTNNDFEFKYTAPSAEERKEIESIRNSYIPTKKTSKKIDELRKLDNKVKNIPLIVSLVLGVVGTLIFGLGLAMVLEWNIIVWGIVVSAVGVVPITIAYPIYIKLTKLLKEKYAKQIIELSNELLNE